VLQDDGCELQRLATRGVVHNVQDVSALNLLRGAHIVVQLYELVGAEGGILRHDQRHGVARDDLLWCQGPSGRTPGPGAGWTGLPGH
jgi:hypothetical protein